MTPKERLQEFENYLLHADNECNLGRKDHEWLISRVKRLTEAIEEEIFHLKEILRNDDGVVHIDEHCRDLRKALEEE